MYAQPAGGPLQQERRGGSADVVCLAEQECAAPAPVGVCREADHAHGRSAKICDAVAVHEVLQGLEGIQLARPAVPVPRVCGHAGWRFAGRPDSAAGNVPAYRAIQADDRLVAKHVLYSKGGRLNDRLLREASKSREFFLQV